jgi:hypothetical protein
MWGVAAAMVVGAGMQAYGQRQAARAQARAARDQAALKEAQAQEMLEKMRIQEERLNLQGEIFKAEQLTQYAASGVQVGTGATLLAMEDTNMKIYDGIEDMKRDTLFKVQQLRMGAGYDSDMARDTINAGAITSAASLIEGGARAYYMTK